MGGYRWVGYPCVPLGYLVYPSGTPWVRSRDHDARAGTLDQQKAMIERVSKEIGALSDLVEENEAKGRVGQVRVSTMRGYS